MRELFGNVILVIAQYFVRKLIMKIFATACALLALTIPTFMTPSQAVADELQEDGCKSVVGTYLATATAVSDPTSVSSELITFNKDGNFTATDSNSGGNPNAATFDSQPFGPIHGSWKCTENQEIIAKGFNFNYQTPKVPASISITTYKLRFNSKTQTVTGKTSFDAYDLKSTPQNPIPLVPSIGGPFVSNYLGNRITPK